MKRITALLAAIILFGAMAASAQNPGDKVLADGNPPLTQGMADNLVRFFEWSLDGKFTKPQRNSLTQMVVAQWQSKDAGIPETVKLMATPQAVETLSEADQKTLHDQFQSALVKQINGAAQDDLTRLLKQVYENRGKEDILDKKSNGAVPQNPPSPQTQSAGVPAQLAGEWLYRISGSSINYKNDVGEYTDPSGELSGYKLKANGTYEHGFLLSSSLYSCNTTIFGYETGVWGVQGNQIIFNDKTATITSKDNCRKAGNYVKKRELRNYSYPFRVERDEYGLKMVLILGDGGEEPYYKQDPGQMGW